MSKPLILIPPSEGKSGGGAGPCWLDTKHSFEEIEQPRREVIGSLEKVMKEDELARSKLLGVKGKKVDEATEANLNLFSPTTLPAIERYTGVLYDALDYCSLSSEMRKKVDEQVVIFSGLWGVLRPRDQIPEYKLKMGARLPEIGVVSRFWKPYLTSVLEPDTKECVWDLLPGEHSAGWDSSITKTRIRVKFLDAVIKNGEKKLVTVSHWNKLLKGALIQYVLEHQLTDPTKLVNFSHPEGYVFAPDLTEVTESSIDVSFIASRL